MERQLTFFMRKIERIKNNKFVLSFNTNFKLWFSYSKVRS